MPCLDYLPLEDVSLVYRLIYNQLKYSKFCTQNNLRALEISKVSSRYNIIIPQKSSYFSVWSLSVATQSCIRLFPCRGCVVMAPGPAGCHRSPWCNFCCGNKQMFGSVNRSILKLNQCNTFVCQNLNNTTSLMIRKKYNAT